MTEAVIDRFVREFRDLVKRRDLAALPGIIVDEPVFHTPRFLRPITRKEHMVLVLQGIVTFVQDFEYHRIFTRGNEAVMEFRGRIGDVVVHGIDIFTVDDAGKIKELTVFLRPTKALEAIGKVEDEWFQRMQGQGGA
ncbi:MAG: nuclear transport factor 2 family protein [Steroidobacteraceae bacterium]